MNWRLFLASGYSKVVSPYGVAAAPAVYGGYGGYAHGGYAHGGLGTLFFMLKHDL